MIGNAKVIINYLFNQDKEKIFELKEKKDKRSLTQNAYYWSLVNQVALALKLPPEHIHFDMIKNYALSELIIIKSEIDVSRIIQECNQLDIPTITKEELEKLKYIEGK